MADPAFIVDKIIELALAIKKAVETVRENKEECRGIERRVRRISELLSLLKEKGTVMVHRATSDALEDLEDAVCRAHEVVTACQGKNICCLFCAAGKLARQLRQVQDEILQTMMLAIFATNVVDFVEAKSQQADAQIFDPARPASENLPSPPPPIVVVADVPPGPQVASVDANLTSHLPSQLPPPHRTAAQVPPLPEHLSPPTTEPPPPPVTYIAPSLPKHLSPRPHAQTPPASSPPRPPPPPPVPTTDQAPPPPKHLPSRPPARLPPHPLAKSTREDSAPPVGSALVSAGEVSGKSEVRDDRKEVPARSEVSSPMLPGLKKFGLPELKAATKNFSVKNKIGSSESVVVYKGVLHNGLVVAIKEFMDPSQFLMARICTELLIASEIQTNTSATLGRTVIRKSYLTEGMGKGRNCLMQTNKYIVNVLGYGYEFIRNQRLVKPHIFLIEEYMPNGNMSNMIYGHPLDWSSRLRIIQGLAWGLHYLHDRNIVHMNMKPDNILLDSDMNPKITTFGIARMLDGPMIHDNNIAGTVGYMPPEYIFEGILSTKFDVYSFGIILLETISGMSRDEPARHQASVQWAWKKHDCKQMDKVFDPSLCDKSQVNEIKMCLEIGLLCTQYETDDRPAMIDVLEMLSGKKELPPPNQPE